ncbi:MAG: ABC transporter permease subunit [Candidatus Saccharicenans sp.]
MKFYGAKILIYGLPAVIIIQTISFFPIVFINVSSSLTNLDPAMEEQAEVLGSRGIRLFKDITLPLITPGVTSGATLVFIISLEDLGAPIGLSGAFGSGLHQKLINFYIYSEFRRGLGSIEQVHASTYALAVILIIISTIAFLGIKKYMTLRQYSMLQKGGRFNPRVRRIKGAWGIILALFLLFVAAMSLSILVTIMKKLILKRYRLKKRVLFPSIISTVQST